MNNMNDYEWIRREVAALAEERGIGAPRAFAAWCLHLVHDLDFDDALEQSATLEGKGGGDGGIDGWYRDEDAATFHVWQCKWTEAPEKAFGRNTGEQLLTGLRDLRDPKVAPDIGPKFALLARELDDALGRGFAVALNLAVPTTFPDKSRETLDKKLASFTREQKSELSATFVYWDCAALSSQDYQRIESGKSLTGVKIAFSLKSGDAMDLQPEQGGIPRGWRALVVNLQGASLAAVAKKYGSNLFDLNVRYALSHRLQRIQSIHKTLESPDSAKFFWFYNNGITIIADDYSRTGQTVEIENPQVVNGCQTVSAFARMFPKFGDDASVLARIIVPPKEEEGQKQANLISERTNNQVPVEARDLKSNDPIHAKMARSLGRMDPPWFYEVKRGQWAILPAPDQLRYGDRRVDIAVLGQSLRMLLTPAEALTRKKDLFEEASTYSSVFSPARIPEEFLFAEITRRIYANFWSANQFAEIRSVCGEQFTDELLRRLMRAKGQLVAHSVALTRRLFATEPDGWSPDDIRRGYTFVSRSPERIDAWTRHIGNAVHMQVKLADAAVPTGEKAPLKKHFERPNQRTLVDLWEAISSNATLWSGPNWRQVLLASLTGQ